MSENVDANGEGQRGLLVITKPQRPALVLACVSHDLIKVWPLPAEMPWWEEPQRLAGQ